MSLPARAGKSTLFVYIESNERWTSTISFRLLSRSSSDINARIVRKRRQFHIDFILKYFSNNELEAIFCEILKEIIVYILGQNFLDAGIKVQKHIIDEREIESKRIFAPLQTDTVTKFELIINIFFKNLHLHYQTKLEEKEFLFLISSIKEYHHKKIFY